MVAHVSGIASNARMVDTNSTSDSFVRAIAVHHSLPTDSLVVRYLERKTKAASRGAKARRSLGNVYALFILAEDFLDGRAQGSRFTDLLARMKRLPFGSKLQNHPLDNRLNDEFARQMGVTGKLLPVQHTTVDAQKARCLSPELLAHDGTDPRAVAAFIVDVTQEYVRRITEKQTSYLEKIVEIETNDDLAEFLEEAFEANSDARLFEIVSFILLAEHFRGKTVWIGETAQNAKARPLRLFRSGRTNANDGGIDFVLQPLGRFFQVTETLDFAKYFLDFEKVNRFPISFVVKFEAPAEEALKVIRDAANKSGRYTGAEVNSYIELFEEVFTLPDLRRLLAALPGDGASVSRMKAELTLQFKLEYGLLD
jgi:hypothetical protein